MNATRYNILWSGIAALIAALAMSCVSPTEPSEVEESYVHLRAAWSPDGKTIAFLASINNTQGIYTVDTSGSNLKLVFAGAVGGPTWSPDAKWLAFSQLRNIWKVQATGDSAQQVTNSGRDVRPAWSRDGKNIAFVRDEGGGVWLQDLSSNSLRRLLDAGDFPSWHPNDSDVVVMVTPPGGNVSSFYAVHRDSARYRILFSLSSPGFSSFSSISPTGQEVALSVTPFRERTQIWKVNLVEGNARQLTEDGGDFAAWNPDGSRIVYTRTTFGDGSLWIMNKDGSGKQRLTTPSLTITARD